MSREDLGLLHKTDLRSFDGESMALVQDMQEAGWRGRKSSNGHVVMYAPDGETTWTFARDSKRGRSGRNARAAFTRWQRRQKEACEPHEKGEGVGIVRHICDHPGCGREFANDRGLGIHRASHGREKELCPKCGRSVMYLETHLRKAHSEDTHKLLEGMMNVFEELEQLRAENEELRRLLAKTGTN